jgi:hypothetical protein
MPAKAYKLPEWLPDQPGSGLSIAKNVYATAEGYIPVKGPLAVTAALAAAFKGGGAFIDSTKTATLLAATATNVYKYTGTAWSSILTATANQTVRFAQYGDNVLLANGGAVTSYSLTGGTTSTPTAAPNAIDIAQTRDFVMAITTANELQWCQFNNSAVWTTGANQADKQPSLWGQLRRIIGGEYMLALTDRAVVRGTYVGVEGGLNIVWQFDEISQEVGVMASGSVCNVGRLVFFLSERGFEMCDGQEVTPIADEKFNRWFFGKFSRQDIANIWSGIDPRNSLVLWAMPGTPGTIIAYNWVLKRGVTIEMDVSGLFSGFTSGVALDALDAIYGNLDAMTISLDDPSLQGGNPLLLIADSTNKLNALSGPNLAATVRYENIEPTPGKRSRIREIRLDSDTLSASATINARMRAGDAESIQSTATMRTNGKLPIRANGRYNALEVTIPAGTVWSYIRGCEVEFEAGDAR